MQWVVNAYLLPLRALLLLVGAAGDRYGRRRLLVAGVGLASLACAATPTLVLLLIGRFVQGAGAAGAQQNSLLRPTNSLFLKLFSLLIRLGNCS
jgi:MFS family permease